jgi:aspartate dehydrogenase
VRTELPLRLGLIGWGAIAQTVAEMLADSEVEIVAVGVRDASSARAALPSGAQIISDPSELAATRPDVVAEAASRESVGPWGRAALNSGADFIVSSVSAFADAELLSELRAMAASNGAQVHIQPGALAGVDALAAARPMGIESVEHKIVKPPVAWRGTPAEDHCDLDSLREAVAFFSGTAAEAASQYPKNANVAMTTALAGIGPHATKITLIADPEATMNRHEISASGPFGQLEVNVRSNALPANPKTSAMAALNLVRAIENRVTPIVI